jgi:hypothetical protein
MTPSLRGVGRRTVLKTIGASSGALLVGVGFSGTAAATCAPRTIGYWKNHDFPSTALPGSDANRLYEVIGVEQDQEAWQKFLAEPAKGDKAIILGQQLVATVLNFQYRNGEDEGDCAYEPLDDYDGSMDDVKDAAADWLVGSSWPEEKQTSWMVDGVDGEELKDLLDAFNNDPSSLGLDCIVENCPIQGGPDGNGAPGKSK